MAQRKREPSSKVLFLMIRRSWLLIPAIAVAFFSACSMNDERSGFGLERMVVEFGEEGPGSFLADCGSRRRHFAKVLYKGEHFPINIRCAGASTLFSSKQSYEIRVLDGKSLKGVTEYRLASTIVDPSMARVPIAFHVFESLELVTPETSQMSLYFDDRFMGLYHYIEDVNTSFAKRKGLNPQEMYVANGLANFSPEMALDLKNNFESITDPENYGPLYEWLNLIHEESQTVFNQEIEKHFNLDNVARYIAGVFLTNHRDGINKNLFYFSSKENPRIFSLIPWDMDLVWRNSDHNIALTLKNHQLFVKILQVPGFQPLVAGYMNDSLAGPASLANLFLLMDDYAERVKLAYKNDRYLKKRYSLNTEIDRLKDFISSSHAELPDIIDDLENEQITLD